MIHSAAACTRAVFWQMMDTDYLRMSSCPTQNKRQPLPNHAAGMLLAHVAATSPILRLAPSSESLGCRDMNSLHQQSAATHATPMHCSHNWICQVHTQPQPCRPFTPCDGKRKWGLHVPSQLALQVTRLPIATPQERKKDPRRGHLKFYPASYQPKPILAMIAMRSPPPPPFSHPLSPSICHELTNRATT